MAIYRNVSLSFWEDNKVVDDFTTDDRYFLLYLLTNPHTNLIGCYEVSIKQMSNELGFDKSKVEELLTRMEEIHKIILYAGETKEILIKNWHKYNWTKSVKLKKPIKENIEKIKSPKLKKYMVSIGYLYGIDTTDADADTVTDTVNNNIFSIVENNFGRVLGSLEYQEIQSWLEEGVSEELIIYATKIAVCNNACSVRYIERILERWKREKITTIGQAEKEQESFRNKPGNVPEWFDKEIKTKTTKEEQEALNEILSEYK